MSIFVNVFGDFFSNAFEERVAEEDESVTDAVFEEFKQLLADEFNFTDGDDEDALFTDAE